MGILKQICCLLAFLSTEYWTLNTARAKDLGIHGVIYSIDEEDPIQLIQQKLKAMEESGELEHRNRELQKKTRSAVERPKCVEGITKATKSRVFYFNPTYVVKEDLYDHQGRIFAKKGMKINPLKTVTLYQNLLFFDGDDEAQKAWVQRRLKTGSVTLVLVKGAPLKLAEGLGVPVYFDQIGFLSTKLGIHHVPAVVNQEGVYLKIEEVALPPSRELIREGAP